MDSTRASLRRRQRLSGWFALAVLAVLASANAAQGQCQYEVTAIIQGPNCFITGPQPTFAQGMNVHGHVVGYYLDCMFTSINHAFVWKPETGLVTLPMPEGVTSARATDINDHGLIVGAHTFTGVGWKAWVFDPETQEYTYLEPLHEGTSATNLTVANAISNNGLVAGSRVISKPGVSPPISNAVIWDTKTGEVIDLGVMNGPNSWANAITDDGTAAGTTGTQFTSNVEAWLFVDGGIQLLGPVPGGLSSGANAMSPDGVIAGGTHLPPGPQGSPINQGALWKHGSWQLLPLLPEATGGSPLDINGLGQAVGRNIGPERATLWQHDEVYGLAELVIDPPLGFAFHRAIATNDLGEIIVRGTLGGKTVGYFLTPADRPITDLNADCVTNVHDLVMLILQWGPCATDDCPADFTGDGVVNVFDLLFLLGNWG